MTKHLPRRFRISDCERYIVMLTQWRVASVLVCTRGCCVLRKTCTVILPTNNKCISNTFILLIVDNGDGHGDDDENDDGDGDGGKEEEAHDDDNYDNTMWIQTWGGGY